MQVIACWYFVFLGEMDGHYFLFSEFFKNGFFNVTILYPMTKFSYFHCSTLASFYVLASFSYLIHLLTYTICFILLPFLFHEFLFISSYYFLLSVVLAATAV